MALPPASDLERGEAQRPRTADAADTVDVRHAPDSRDTNATSDPASSASEWADGPSQCFGPPHFEAVNRQGRSASIVRDNDGHVAYPSLVPPEVESPPYLDGEDEAAIELAPTQPRGRMRSESDGALHDLALGRVPSCTAPASAPASESDNSEAEVVPTTTATTTAAAAAVSPRARYQRSSTMPLPARNRGDSMALFHEMRRTATLQWNTADVDNEGNGHEAVTEPSFAGGGEGAVEIRRRLREHVRKQKKPDAQRMRPPFSGGQFWRRRLLHWNANGPGEHLAEELSNGQSYRRDGRLAISVKDTSHTGYLAKAVGAAVRKMAATENSILSHPEADESTTSTFVGDEGTTTATTTTAATATPAVPPAETPVERLLRERDQRPCPRLNIVIMVIGSRGDAQPFLKIGRVLKEQYGHRVRIATHPAFRDFIEKESGLEFFSVGGDPAELMAFMVKNPGMIPSLETVKSGDIGRRRAAMAEMFQGFWRACTEATDDRADVRNMHALGEREPFVADAIIANPPSFAHTHCAEALGIPLHLMFTFPYTPTQAFPHPLAIIRQSEMDLGYTNFMSYPLVDMMVWQGLGDLVNDLRVNTLGLDPVSKLWAPGSTYRMHVPFTYLWSPGLVPKPADWGPEIDIAGFVFLELASSFRPPPALEAFLAASSEKPVYIGFGSIVVDDADRFTAMIYAAVRQAGVRALVSKGWGGLGGGDAAVPPEIFLLENTPHDWLFPQVSACVIHGGAGTTAMALKCGLPTMIVPFFGDQYFWGSMVEKAGVGPRPVPYKQLTVERLTAGILQCLGAEARTAAQRVAASIAHEGDGAANACQAFHRTLRHEGGLSAMRCAVFANRMAAWESRREGIRLSAAAAELLVREGYLGYGRLQLLRNTEWNDFEGPGEPITAIFGSLVKSVQDGLTRGPLRAGKSVWQGRRKRAAVQASKAGATGATGVGGDGLTLLLAIGAGAGTSARALVLAPIELGFAVCQGFHNAPRLYGDDTVRQTPRVTGVRSGLEAAGREFVLGLYDGVTGLVMLPVRHTRDGGLHGFVSGVGMGLMGFCLKGISAIIGPFGYAAKGLVRALEPRGRPTRMLRRARIAQGQRDVLAMDEAARRRAAEQAASGWETMRTLWEEVEGGRRGGRPSRDEKALEMMDHSLYERPGSRGPGHEHEHEHEHHLHHPHFCRHPRELDVALRSAEIAAVALAAVRRGKSLESIVGRQSCHHTQHHYERHQQRKKEAQAQADLEKGQPSV